MKRLLLAAVTAVTGGAAIAGWIILAANARAAQARDTRQREDGLGDPEEGR